MNLFKIIDEKEIKVKLVAVECKKCNTPMKIDKKVIDRDEAFQCPCCRNIGFPCN